MFRRRFSALACVVLAGLVACALAACGSDDSSDTTATSGQSTGSSTAASGGASKGTLNIAYLDEQTGPLAYQSSADAARAAVDAANAAGGVNGYKINMKVYDTGGTPQNGVAAVRQVINDNPTAAVWATTASIDSGLKLLAKSGIPGFNEGGTPNAFYTKTFFPWEGVNIGATTTAWAKQCVDTVGKNVAVAGSAVPGIEVSANGWADAARMVGGKVVYNRVGIDGTNNAAITQAAKQIKDSGADCVLSLMYPGSPQMQVALNQLGGGVTLVESDGYGPDLEKQFGSSADGMMFATYTASLNAKGNKGVDQYLADMKQYAPDANPYCLCATGYVTMKVFFEALKKVQGEPTHEALVAAGDKIDGFDADGLSAPIKFPELKSQASACLGYSQLKNGKWTAIEGNSANGMVCGEPFKLKEAK